MTAPTETTTTNPPQSTFVTVLAWVFIVFSGFAVFVSALQNFMLQSMPFEDLDTALQDSTFAGTMPAPARAMFEHIQLVALAFLLIALLTLISSVGLLRRRNWARLLFMGLLGFEIASVIAGMLLQHSFLSSFGPRLEGVESQDSTFQQFEQQFESMVAVMRVVTIVLSLGIAALLGWILAKLASPRIRAEFVPSQAA